MRSWSALPMMLLLPRCAGLSVSTAVHRPAAVLRPALLASCRVSGHARCSTTLEPTAAPGAGEPSASSGELPRSKVGKLLAEGTDAVGRTVLLKGWVRTVRDLKNFSFVEVNDGSSLAGMQVVAQSAIPTYGVIDELSTGAACEVVGEVVASQGKGQAIELAAQELTLVGGCPADAYPLQKKRHSLEFLRTIAHLRPRSNLFGAVSRVRSSLAQATHSFFAEEGFKYVQTPLLTASDCEGAGEMFRVTTLDPTAPPPPVKDSGKTKGKDADAAPADPYAADFFGKQAFLTVSGQLSAETYACALGDVYTFGPTFRAEQSNTARHLAEFWMIEPEMAFADLTADMDNAEAYVKYVVGHVMEHCSADLTFFGSFVDKELLPRLTKLVEQPFARVSYTEAVELLQKEIKKNPKKWEFPDVEFGTDLSTEHERWLAEKHFGTAVFVYDYPKSIKAFYMRDNEDGKTVAAMDLLVPGVGELIGGSQREERLDKLLEKMGEVGLDPEDYWWYLDLRRYGSVPHAGYGLGFERLVCYVTGVSNIRDAIAFPRFPGSCDF
jgi:asparaginyl-tRNA synthetase